MTGFSSSAQLRHAAKVLLDYLGQAKAVCSGDLVHPRHGAIGADWADTSDPVVVLAAAEFDARRARDRELGEDFSNEPAWDMLLLLFATHDKVLGLGVDDLIKRTCRFKSAGERWLRALAERGLVSLESGQFLPAEFVVKLTAAGRTKVRNSLIGSATQNIPALGALVENAQRR